MLGAVVDWQSLQYQIPAVGMDLAAPFLKQGLMLLLQPSPRLATCLQGLHLASAISRMSLQSAA